SYRPYLREVANRILGRQLSVKVDASDVVQDCFQMAHEQFTQFRGADAKQWRHWLLAMVRNRAKKIRRHWHQEMRDVDREQPLTPSSSLQFPVAGDGSSPSQELDRRERVARLLALIERLRPDYRDVIALRYLENLPYAEVAARMHRSEEAVRKLCERAFRRVRAECGEEL